MSKVKEIVSSYIIVIFLASTATGCGAFTRLMKGQSNSTPVVSESTESEASTVPAESGSGNSSQQSSDSSEPRSKLDVLRQMNCQDPSQTDYILDGIYQVGWTAGGNRYEGILQMREDRGLMQLKYFDHERNTEDVVEQAMLLAACPQGLFLIGINPTFPNSQNPNLDYASDNILMRRETDGSITLTAIDDNGVTAPVEMTEISN